MNAAEDRPAAPGERHEGLYPPTVQPAPAPLPLLSFIRTFVRNPLETLPQAVFEEPIVVMRRHGMATAWVTDPELTERVLLHEHQLFPKTKVERRIFETTLGNGILTSNGENWRWQRRAAAPLFRHQEVMAHVPAMTAAAQAQIERWRRAPPGNLHYIDRDMTETTFEVFTGTILAGADPDDGEVIKRANARLLGVASWEVAWALLGIPRWVLHPGTFRMRVAARSMRAAVGRIIAKRRAEAKGEDQDILGRFLAARHPDSGEPMSDALLIDNLLTFIAAGHETTAKALTWTLYLLARAPEWQERVRAEVAAVCGGDSVGSAQIGALPVTTMVLKEAMRLYPPAAVLTREVAAPVRLGDETLMPGTVVVLPVFAIHRHRRLWEDADRFDPDRFRPEAEERQRRTQFMPFGFGPRSCIGMAFAMLEATAVLATLVRGVRFGWDGRHLPQPVSRITLGPRGGMPLAVEII